MTIGENASQEPAQPASAVKQMFQLETWGLLLKAARPKQWVKNLIAYAPLIFSRNADHPILFLFTTLCFMSFCLVSGGIYIANDLVDIEADRKHPTKCARPIASGKLNSKLALGFGLLLIVLGLTVSLMVRPSLCLVTAAYLCLAVSYSFFLKHDVILDVFGIAAGFVLRAVGGAVAIGVASSGWFLACTSLGALFLALEKRRQELRLLGGDSRHHRKALAGYSMALLDRMESIVVPSLLTSYAFYSFLSFHGQWMMLTLPFVMYGVMRYQYLSVHSTTTGQPEDVFWKDRPIQISILCWIITCVLVVYGVPSHIQDAFESIDSYRILK